jgi:quercetin dioxygenase-like cupin family protein
MEELDKGLKVSLRGEEALRILELIGKQLDKWALVMPRVEPLVLDFGLGDFWRIGETEFWIANETEAGYCGKFLFVFAGQTCPEHLHKEKLETFYIVKGKVKMLFREAERELKAGDVLRVERGAAHRFTGIEPSLLLEVSKPSIIADNYFKDRRIPIGGNFKV